MASEGDMDFGNEKTKLMEKTDDQADERGNETTGFEPAASSTPAPNGNQRQTTLNRPGEQPSFDELPDTPDGLASTTFTAENELRKEFPFADKSKIKYKMDAKGRLEVGLIEARKPYYRLLSEIPGKKGEYQINKKIPREVLIALGKGRRETIQEKMQMLRENINENKKIIDDPFENQTEKNKARERKKRQTEELTALARELDQLIKRNYQPSESIELETFQKNNEVRQERVQEIQREEEEQDTIINDENSTPAEKEIAKERKNKLVREKNEINNESEIEIEQLKLGDRLREKVKAIFKKYGFTVTAVLLAVGTTIGVVLSSLSNGLKGVAKGVGNGFKTLGKKIAEILPGLLGAVVSFVFRTAGKVIGFLGKHAWLLILAVAAFLFERVMKRHG